MSLKELRDLLIAALAYTGCTSGHIQKFLQREYNETLRYTCFPHSLSKLLISVLLGVECIIIIILMIACVKYKELCKKVVRLGEWRALLTLLSVQLRY